MLTSLHIKGLDMIFPLSVDKVVMKIIQTVLIFKLKINYTIRVPNVMFPKVLS